MARSSTSTCTGSRSPYLDDLRTLWEVELPEQPEHQPIRREYELRRAEATAAGFARLEALGPVIVEAKLSEDPLAGRSLALSLEPERAELNGEQADVVRQLLDGHRTRLARSSTPAACKKRRQRSATGTLRCVGRGERSQTHDLRVHVQVIIGGEDNDLACDARHHTGIVA